MALGEAAAVGVAHEGEMAPRRWGGAECAVDEELARGGAEEILAAHDLGDRHRDVVGDDREFICRDVVAAPDHEVAEVLARGERLRAAHRVVEADRLAVRHAEAPRRARR